MSAMDQAFIKAYAKDPAPAAGSVEPAPAPSTVPLGSAPRSGGAAVVARSVAKPIPSAPAANTRVIEQIYHEGSLYRIEAPAAPRRAAVPTPHFQLPPRTSPRRNVRKSLLKLLGHESDTATPMPVEPPHARNPRIARVDAAVPVARAEVITRAEPAKRAETVVPVRPAVEPIAAEMYSAPATQPARTPRPTRRKATRPALPPSVPAPIVAAPILPAPATEPIPVTASQISTPPISTPPVPQAAAMSAPATAELAPAIAEIIPSALPSAVSADKPIDLVAELGPRIDIHGHWDDESLAASGSIVVFKEPAYLDYLAAPAAVELPDVELPAAELPPATAGNTESALAATPSFRLDPPHAAIAGPPHARFAPPSEEPVESGSAKPTAEPQADDVATAETEITPDIGETPIAPEAQIAADASHVAVLLADESSAETAIEPELVEALAEADLDFADLETLYPTAEPLEPATEGTVIAPSEPRSTCHPVWEVDHFQWPATVERLVTDQDGYFGQASGRLLAAVRDGLRTLAITGSRRGEGRTTLALCLARAAARAGIQVAVIDADFGRPQLASRIGLEVTNGWQEAALGEIPLSEAAIRSLADNITVLPLEASAARAELSLADPRVTATLRAAAATFELVILDLGPLTGSELSLFPEEEACPLDAAIIVRDLRYASAAESEAIGERLYAAGIEAVGIAENFVAPEDAPAPPH
jgi:Mrp family chromosome partitioning ATPase